MADISKIKTLNGTTYNIKDAKAIHNVYNDLDSTSTTDALSANMGKTLKTSVDALNDNIANMTESKKIKLISGVIKPDANGVWSYITTGSHDKMNLVSVANDSTGSVERVKIGYGFTAKNVLAFSVTPDETFSKKYTIGASVGTSEAFIEVSRLPTVIGGYVAYNESTSSWDISNSSFTSATFKSNGELRLTYTNTLILDVNSKYKKNLQATTASGLPVMSGVIDTDYVSIYFMDYNGNFITTPSRNLKAYVTLSTVGYTVDASSLTDQSGNFWIIGVMEVD